MSEGNKRYDWQKIKISPHNASEILDQMEFLQKTLDIDSSGLVIPPEERQAMYEELSRLSKMYSAAFTEEMDKRIEAARQGERQADQRTARQANPWFQLWQFSHMNCVLLWLLFILSLLSLPMVGDLSKDLPSTFPVWCIMTAGSLAWAVWASSPQKG